MSISMGFFLFCRKSVTLLVVLFPYVASLLSQIWTSSFSTGGKWKEWPHWGSLLLVRYLKCIYASVFRILFVIPYSSLCRVSTWLWFVVLVVVMLLCVNFRQSYTLCVNWAQKTSCIIGDIKKKSRRRVIHFVYIKNLRWSSYNVRIKTKHY